MRLKNHFIKFLNCLIGMTFFSSCMTKTLDDYYEEGQVVIHAIVNELETTHSAREVLAISSRLQKLFLELVNIMIAAQEFTERSSQPVAFEPLHRESVWSDLLREELNRLYQIEGVREIIEKSQEEALYRLDAYEKKHQSLIKA